MTDKKAKLPRRVAPWQATGRDRMRRKAGADARAAIHKCGPTCKRFRTAIVEEAAA